MTGLIAVRGRQRPRTVLASLAGFALAVAPASGAQAATMVERQVQTAATSATWGAVAVTAGAAAGTGALSVNWQTLGSKQFAIADLVNTGSLDLSNMTLELATVRNAGGGTAPFPTITLDACVGASWVDATNTCPGTLTSIGSTTGGTLTSAIAVGAGQRLSIRVSSSGNPGSGSRFTTTLGVRVTRAQARPAQTVSS